jgi:hypothetical protein
MKTPDQPPKRSVDRTLGRVVLRFWAVVAFLGAAASATFAMIVLVNGHAIPGIILLALGVLFLWLGRRAWRDRSGLGDVLNRDFERPGSGRSP